MQTLEWPINTPTQVGTTPLWHPDEQCLYWSDARDGHLYKFNPADNTNTLCLSDRPIGAMTLQQDGALLLFRDQANVVIFKNEKIVETIISSIADFKHTIFSAAAADSQGAVLCSVLSDAKHTGRLLRLGQTGRLEHLDDGFGIPAGMGFDATGTRFFLNDAHSTRRITWRYDYDVETGIVSDKRVFHSCLEQREETETGAPMGLAVDTEGRLVIARWGGCAIVLHDVDGVKIETDRIPVRKPAGVAFGGQDLNDIYISTSGGHRRMIDGLHAGGIARMRIDGFVGSPLFRSNIKGDKNGDGTDA